MLTVKLCNETMKSLVHYWFPFSKSMPVKRWRIGQATYYLKTKGCKLTVHYSWPSNLVSATMMSYLYLVHCLAVALKSREYLVLKVFLVQKVYNPKSSTGYCMYHYCEVQIKNTRSFHYLLICLLLTHESTLIQMNWLHFSTGLGYYCQLLFLAIPKAIL